MRNGSGLGQPKNFDGSHGFEEKKRGNEIDTKFKFKIFK